MKSNRSLFRTGSANAFTGRRIAVLPSNKFQFGMASVLSHNFCHVGADLVLWLMIDLAIHSKGRVTHSVHLPLI